MFSFSILFYELKKIIMIRKKIAWITVDSFIDVDLPIIPVLANKYDIHWYVVLGKNTDIDYYSLINDRVDKTKLMLTIIRLKNRIRNPFLCFEYIKLVLKLKKEIADIYYIDMPGMPYFLPLVRFFLGVKKTIIATHNVSTPKGAINYRLAKKYMQYTLKSFNNFHVFSKSQHKILVSKHPFKNVLIAPLALKDFGESKLSTPDLITFLNFGIIREYKRVDVLIEAANIAYEKTNIKFIVKIAGKCDHWAKYVRLIKYPFLFDLRLKSIPNDEVPDLFASSHYFVLPYQDIAQSGALTVALKYNLPVLASDLEGFKEFVVNEETGFLFEAASVNALSELFIYLLENHKIIYSDLKKNQLKYIEENYMIEAIADKYTEYFESL